MKFIFKDAKSKNPKLREKASKVGLSNLSTPELIALLIETGTKTVPVLQAAQAITRSVHSLEGLTELSTEQLQKLPGVGVAKGWRLAAAFELGKRCFEPPTPTPQIMTPSDVLSLCIEIRTATREHILAFYLDARHRLKAKETIAIGTLNQASIEPRDIFSRALALPCASIILVHNHPSGDPTPSTEDIEFTKTLAEIGSWLGVQLLDHIIVSNTSHISLREKKHIT